MKNNFDLVGVILSMIQIICFLSFICLICFFIVNKVNKKKEIQITDRNELTVRKSFILYIISFIPYLYLIYSCAFGISSKGWERTVVHYGVDAFLYILMLNAVVPIYTIILIYQIIYTIRNYVGFSSNQKLITKCIVIFLITTLLIAIIPHVIKENIDNNYNENKIFIENY